MPNRSFFLPCTKCITSKLSITTFTLYMIGSKASKSLDNAESSSIEPFTKFSTKSFIDVLFSSNALLTVLFPNILESSPFSLKNFPNDSFKTTTIARQTYTSNSTITICAYIVENRVAAQALHNVAGSARVLFPSSEH